MRTHLPKKKKSDGNVLALLSGKACCTREDYVIFDASPSDELSRLLAFYRNGLYCYMQVANTLASVAASL